MTDAWEMHQAETGLNPGPLWRDRGIIIANLTRDKQALEERVAELEGSCQMLRDQYQGALAEVERLREAYMTTANELRALASPAVDATPEPTPTDECTCRGMDEKPGCTHGFPTPAAEPQAEGGTATFASRTSSRLASCPPEVQTAVEAIKRRLSWPSMHWGAEDMHPDALPHIAAAALDSIRPAPVADPSGDTNGNNQ